MKKNFNERSFTLFTINYIIGFGFITTIMSLIKLNLFGIIVIAITAIITLGVSLVFARLVNHYPNEYGGSYAYAKKLNNKHFSFFMGWNQYIQGPILASTAPLFLATAASYLTSDNTILWIIRGLSITLFIGLVLISTLGLKLNKYIILSSAIVKWIILLSAFIISIYIAASTNNFASNLQVKTINPYLIFSNIILFIYAFAGTEDVAAMAKDVSFKNFRKILMIAFVFMLTFYVIFYAILLGVDSTKIQNFSQIFQIVFGSAGIILFVVGLFFNGISSRISINISTARKVVPLAEDGFLFKALAKTNSKNEFKNAMWFNAALTIISMLIFWLLPMLLGLEDFFESVIQIGSIAFLIQHLLTIVIALVLEHKKVITKIALWEKILYYLVIAIIAITLVIFIFPFILNEPWTVQNTIMIISYPSFILLGYGFKFIANKIDKRKNIKTNIINKQETNIK